MQCDEERYGLYKALLEVFQGSTTTSRPKLSKAALRDFPRLPKHREFSGNQPLQFNLPSLQWRIWKGTTERDEAHQLARGGTLIAMMAQIAITPGRATATGEKRRTRSRTSIRDGGREVRAKDTKNETERDIENGQATVAEVHLRMAIATVPPFPHGPNIQDESRLSPLAPALHIDAQTAGVSAIARAGDATRSSAMIEIGHMSVYGRKAQSARSARPARRGAARRHTSDAAPRPEASVLRLPFV